MHTHCPSCSAVLEVTEEILNVANGKVRCGDCGTVFNGYDFLEKTDGDIAPVLSTKPPQSHPINELSDIEDELSSLDERFAASGRHIDQTIKTKSSPNIDVSFKATSPNTASPAQTNKPSPNKLDIDLSKKIDAPKQPSKQHTPIEPTLDAPTSVATKNHQPEPQITDDLPEIDLPDIDLGLDTPAQLPETVGINAEEIAESNTSIDDIIHQFMEADQDTAHQTDIDPSVSHALEIDEMIAESGIIVDVSEDDESFQELMAELNEDSEPQLEYGTKKEALDYALSDKATPEDDIFAGLTGVNLDDALSTRATDEAIQSLFQADKDATATESTPDADLTSKLDTAQTQTDNTTPATDIEQGMNELFGADDPATPKESTKASLFNPAPKPRQTTQKKPVSKKAKTLGILGCIVLLLAFCAQALYAARYTLAQNPTTTHITVQACKYIPLCELRDPSAYQLLSREMTAHPVLKNVLVLNVRLTNTAKFEQPLPSVVVSMTNALNKQVATNTFKNSDYEQDHLWVKAGETREIQILLKDPDARASGFEVGFK